MGRRQESGGRRPAAEREVRAKIAAARRVVVKIGSSLLMDPHTRISYANIKPWCVELVNQLRRGRQVLLVSSGAVAQGTASLGWPQPPTDLVNMQAAAAVGQMGLVGAYEAAFAELGRRTALVLLTHEDVADRQRYLNARSTLARLLELGVVPIINENDTVATDEIRFGDNDALAALVASLLSAEALVLLTDVDGLYRQDPRLHDAAERIAHAEAADPDLDQCCGLGGVLGRGGMVTKLAAARTAGRSGVHTVIADGGRPDVLKRIFAGERAGTCLAAGVEPPVARKRWIAGQPRPKGDLVLDAGAAAALRKRGHSLLPVGVVAVRGGFRRGEVVRCVTEQGEVVAQGLVNYASAEADRIKGAASGEIGKRLGYALEPELMHRDNLVVI